MPHKKLNAWEQAMVLVLSVYDLTRNFPEEEKYGLVSQVRRSAVSIPSNIAEGSARQTKKEKTQFMYIALGSLAELETQFLIADDLGYIKSNPIIEKIEVVRKLLMGLIRYYKNKTE